jgi:VWFA-related protein
MLPTRPILVLALPCLIAVSAAVAQTQTSQMAANQPAAGPANTTAPPAPMVVQSNAYLVLVDVVVTNQGSAVRSLDASHFHVLQDGHEQTIASFEEHKPAAIPPAAAKPAALPPNVYTNSPVYPPATAVNVLLLDALNTPMADQVYVRRQMLQYMGQIAPGTTLAVFTLSSRLRMVEGFTTDVAQLTKAMQSPKVTPQPSVVLDQVTNNGLESTAANMASLQANPNPSDAVPVMQQFVADVETFQTDDRVQMTLDAMQQLARYLSAVPGRKNLIWFSGSFPISLDPDLSQTTPSQSVRNYMDLVRETSQLLSAARVAVYPVDARGLMNPQTTDASYTPTNLLASGGNSGRSRGSTNSKPVVSPSMVSDNMKFMEQTMAEQDLMKEIAEQTGGQAFLNTNGLKEAVASAVEDGSSYYTIGYVPQDKQLDGKFHKLQLRTDNPQWQLAYRRGYYADVSGSPSKHSPGKTSLIMAATLHGAPPATQILFHARVLPATDPQLKNVKPPAGPAGELTAALKGPPHRYIVDLLVDPRWIEYETTPDGGRHAAVEFTLVAFDTETRRVNYLDRGFVMNLKPDEYAQIMAAGIHVRLPFDLPSGQTSLRIAVHDLAAGSAGSLEVPVTVATP